MKLISRKTDFASLPSAVLFDTDNTLYHYPSANRIALRNTADRATQLLGISQSNFYRTFDLARSDIKAYVGSTASSHSRLLYFKRMLELLGLRAELQIALDLEHTFWREFLAASHLFDGVLDFLLLLRKRSIPIAVVTDLTTQIQLRKLAYFGLQHTFDAIVTSEEAGADKPDIRNFKLIQHKLHLPSLESAWMIGDNPTADILGSKKAGCIAIQKLHDSVQLGLGACSPDAYFTSYNDIYQFFLSIST